MYSTKKNVLQLVAALKAYGIDHVVLSPGSRNAPLIHTFTQHPFFNCHLVVDERSAAFFALGLIQELRRPVAICCTSGTALLNYAPAVAEAFYQQLPLIVISADRSPAWIGQMDGQTIPQNNIFGSLSKKSVQLPEINNNEDEWYCRRLVHEAILASQTQGNGPVHINIPILEPLFNFSAKELPHIEPIKRHSVLKVNTDICNKKWLGYKKRMIVIGQLPQNNNMSVLVEQLAHKFDCVIVAEHLSNTSNKVVISNFDSVIHTLNEKELSEFAPDLLITCGGHIVSKRLKHFLRKNKASAHWNVTDTGEVTDLFQSLTDIIDTNPEAFFSELISLDASEEKKEYSILWNNRAKKITPPDNTFPFCDITAVGKFINALPANAALHLANSSSVRNAQFFALDKSIEVFCNRGTNGIDGALSTVAGFATVHKGLTFLIVGDLSFFYDLNALWNNQLPDNMRILLLNNGGGGIFHQLPDLNKSNALASYVAAGHSAKAQEWAIAGGLEYLSAGCEREVEEGIKRLVSNTSDRAIVLEVFTSIETNTSAIKEYYNNLKNKEYVD